MKLSLIIIVSSLFWVNNQQFRYFLNFSDDLQMIYHWLIWEVYKYSSSMETEYFNDYARI